MPAVEPTLLPIKVHRTPFPFRASVLAPHQLREHLEQRAAAAEEGAVVAVGGDDAVLSGDAGLHTHGDGFLAVVEVAESADEFGLVERVGSDLHAAHEGHVTEKGKQLGGRSGDGA
ncbi:hypothetical protein V8G54_014680 [Vigna mungo]|uniref:Uncharacterized protein n=1 Tax=Vigna mungo TaxID=3915 RepID=A0AAQ3NJL8_VIGMU